jgi:hypothetical protein|tara:strand:- start:68883 stop:69200 length:318 start_codon:yes stop_codon:yes gene_type:complete
MAFKRLRWGALSIPTLIRLLLTFIISLKGLFFSKKKPLSGLGLITVFLFYVYLLTPSSTPILAAEKDTYLEEDSNANKVVNSDIVIHNGSRKYKLIFILNYITNS